MRLSHLSSLSVCGAFALLVATPVDAAEPTITFSNPITIERGATPLDILEQSDNYNDGTLTIGDWSFEIDAYGHAVLADQRNIFCRWLGLFCPSVDEEVISITQDEAKSRVTDRVVTDVHAEMERETGKVLPILAFAWPEPIPAGTAIRHFFAKNRPLNVLRDSWFFMLDLEPYNAFGHRMEYVLVDVRTGAITQTRAFSPPIMDGEPWLLDDTERFASDMRFYPTNLADLPPAAPWPLRFNAMSAKPPTHSTEAEELATAPSEPPVNIVEHHSITDLFLSSATAADPSPCPEPRRKVAIVINGEPRERNIHFEQSAGAAMAMFRNLGVAQGDMHYITPAKIEKPEDVVKEIERIGSAMGPCDKLFFYITGHGTLIDENNDDIPDEPSSSIAYGEGELGKGRYGNSFMEALTKAKAGIVNITVQSCFAGSLPTMIDQFGIRPPEGTTWHIFPSSDAMTSSYGNSDPYRASHYTETLTYCVAMKMAERGITNPTIEQIESITRECHDQIVANPEERLKPDPAQDIGHESITISGDVRIQEGDEGVRYAEFTVSRSPATRALRVTYSTYDPDPEGDVSNYANPQDYQWQKTEASVEFAPGETTKIIRIAIYGDREVEEDETFGVWFGTLAQIRRVTIVDDDKPTTVTSSSSSTATTTGDSSTTVVVTGPIVVNPGGDIGGVGGWIIDETDKKNGMGGGSITIDPGGWVLGGDDYGYGKLPDITIEVVADDVPCPECEEIAQEVEMQAWICQELSLMLADAEARLADIDRGIKSAVKDILAAQDALDAFNNPSSYAESEGRRVTSSDLAAERRFRRQQWLQYHEGEISAQELEEKWKQDMTDAEREQMKKEIRQELENAVEGAKNALKRLEEARAAAVKEIENVKKLIEECEDELDALMVELMECDMRCPTKKGPTDESSSSSSETSSSSSSSSSTEGTGTGIKPPKAKCPACKELEEEIDEVIDDCMAIADDLADVNAKIKDIDGKIGAAEKSLKAAEDALAKFDDPSSYAESEGRRVTSTDLAVEAHWSRGLWEQYRNGDMTAHELEAKWEAGMTPEEREKAATEARSELLKQINMTQDVLTKLREQRAALDEERKELEEEQKNCEDELAELLAELEECEKRCVEEEIIESSSSSESSESSIDDGEEESSSSEGEEEDEDDKSCGGDSTRLDECRKNCEKPQKGECTYAGVAQNGDECFMCKPRTVTQPRCAEGTSTQEACKASCDGGRCESAGETNGLKCYRCVHSQAPQITCDPPTTTEAECRKGCDGACDKAYTRSDGVKCFSCGPIEESSSSRSSTPPTTQSCPSGKTKDRSSCEDVCGPKGGTCSADNQGCYGCTVLSCPSGTYKNECPTSCEFGCDVAGQQESTTCYVCKKSCEDVCGQEGLQVGTDWTSYIQSQITPYTCVSSANVHTETTTIGSCTCSRQPTVTVDQTKPVCKGSVCGDVTCGESVSCQQGTSTVTVSCSWGGWKNVGENKFQPIIGQ
jgi:septal ring factor EnvC (AmiA/AmiB activator)